MRPFYLTEQEVRDIQHIRAMRTCDREMLERLMEKLDSVRDLVPISPPQYANVIPLR